MRSGRVEGRVAIVTGGGGAIGTAIAARLVAEGARVTLTDIDATLGAEAARSAGCGFARQDVGDEAGWTALVAQVERDHGALHVLVNNAGIEGEVAAGSPEATTLEDWRRVQRVNLDGVFLGCRAALPAMRRAGGGSIVNIASIVTWFASPNAAAYGASKAGVRQLTMSVAAHGAQGPGRVRCNSVHPGMIRTRMLDNIFEQGAKRLGVPLEEVGRRQLARIPMGELGTPEDVARVVLFLASDESRYVTGAGIDVDGGWNIG